LGLHSPERESHAMNMNVFAGCSACRESGAPEVGYVLDAVRFDGCRVWVLCPNCRGLRNLQEPEPPPPVVPPRATEYLVCPTEEQCDRALTCLRGCADIEYPDAAEPEPVEWQQLSLTMVDAQFLQLRDFQAHEICRIFEPCRRCGAIDDSLCDRWDCPSSTQVERS
jgi:hypothetical protein